MMAAVTLLADTKRNVAAVVAATEYVNAERGVLLLELGDVFEWHCEGEVGHIEGFFIGYVIGESIWVICTRMKGCQDGPDESEVFLTFTTACFLASHWGVAI